MHPVDGRRVAKMRVVRSFRLGSRFPAISITGSHCDLDCPHCAGRPLAGMLNADSPEKLLEMASRIESAGGTGFLLSGGCDSDGMLPIGPYLSAIQSIKNGGRLKINAHVGYPRDENAGGLVRSGIDVFSLNFPVSDDVGFRIMRVPRAVDRYFEAFDSLREQGARKVVPHILIGLTDLEEEIRGLEMLRADPPVSMVVIAFFPLLGTPMRDAPPTEEGHIVEFVKASRSILPDTKIALGCMRKRGNHRMESLLMQELVDGIVMPSRKAIASAQKSIVIEELEGCCALYL